MLSLFLSFALLCFVLFLFLFVIWLNVYKTIRSLVWQCHFSCLSFLSPQQVYLIWHVKIAFSFTLIFRINYGKSNVIKVFASFPVLGR